MDEEEKIDTPIIDQISGEVIEIKPTIRYPETKPQPGMVNEPRQKVYVNGVDVSVLISREMYFDNQGKPITTSLKDHTKDIIKGQFASLDDFLNRWNSTDKKEVIIKELEDQGVLVDALRDAVNRDLPAKSPGKWYVYVIECEDGSLYKGMTIDLRNRWREHKNGEGSEWTRTHKPIELIHYEVLNSETEAVEREKYLKSGRGRIWLQHQMAMGNLSGRQAGVDLFDLICHVAFDQPPMTRKERANQVKKRDYFTKYGEQARKVLEALLEKYSDEGITNLESMDILRVRPLDQFGGPLEIIDQFGGKKQYLQALKELEQELYKTGA
jgi:predicted GIY-YIG superfamily endonuclease